MNLLLILIALLNVLLIVVILLQNPKGGGLDPTFGGSGATQLFGAAKSADFVEKLTWYLAAAIVIGAILAVFMIGDAPTGLDIVTPQ